MRIKKNSRVFIITIKSISIIFVGMRKNNMKSKKKLWIFTLLLGPSLFFHFFLWIFHREWIRNMLSNGDVIDVYKNQLSTTSLPPLLLSYRDTKISQCFWKLKAWAIFWREIEQCVERWIKVNKQIKKISHRIDRTK
jgi:hypothetical protein